MGPRRKLTVYAGAGIVVLLASLVIVACQSSVSPGESSTTNGSASGGPISTSTSDVLLGKTIYVNGVDEAGKLIPRSGGIGMMGGSGCITCHGSDGRGGTVAMMMSQFDVPDIRWSTLSQPMQSQEGGMEPPYDPTTFAQAVREGIGSDGSSLEAPMPQWQLNDRQVDALVAYLMTL